MIDEKNLYNLPEILSQQLSLKKIDLTRQVPSAEAIKLVPAEMAVKKCCIPVKITGNLLHIAVNDPTDYELIDELRLLLYISQNGRFLEPVFCLASRDDICKSIKNLYGIGAEVAERLMTEPDAQERKNHSVAEDKDLIDTVGGGEPSIVHFVNLLLIDAIENRATDVHIEPFESKLRIRQRIDGMLYEVPIPASMTAFTSNIVSRIKIMAQLDIAEKRLPQDGRIKMKLSGQQYDLRISILPSPYGEAVNIRILSQHMSFMPLQGLGLGQSDMPIVEDLIKRPNGVILVTGPTGSGKTTLLYACLSQINTTDRKILTIEDPIEYRMDGVIQMQTLSKIDFSFARALRSMLRHDPDVMMIGEIRDTETAQITVRSALTGHLVFSTLHTNDAAGAIARLLDMGIEPFLATSSLLAVLAIRLVRILCPHCKKKIDIDLAVFEQFGLTDAQSQVKKVFEPVGCSLCRNTGFAGRTGIFEILRIWHSMKISLVLFLTLLCLKVSILRNNRLLETYQQRLLDISPVAEKLQFLQQQLSIIENQLQGNIAAIEIIFELFKTLPKDITIHYLSIERNEKVRIRAQAKLLSQSFDCIGPLEKSDFFENVVQSYANQRKIEDSVLIDFEIVADIQKRHSGETK